MSRVSIAEASRQLSRWINQAAYGHDVVILTSRGQPKAVILGIEEFQELVQNHPATSQPLMPYTQFQSKFRQAMIEAGYDTREKIVNLARQVRYEIAEERQQNYHTAVEQE